MLTFVVITSILLVAMFIYFRQRIMVVEENVTLLSDTVRTMAGFTVKSLTKQDAESDGDASDIENDSESEDESDDESEESVKSLKSESESVKSLGSVSVESVKDESKNKSPIELVNELVCELCDVFDKTTVSDDEIVVKKIEVDLYNSLTLKELKERVTVLNGPKLKTKKELVDFLKNIESNKNLTPEL